MPVSIPRDASDLRLYLALKDGVWLGLETKEATALKKGVVLEAIRALVHEFMELYPLDIVRTCFVDENDDVKPKMGPQDVHVLVIAPEVYFPMKRLCTTIHDCKDEEPKMYSLERSRLSFVDRTDAIKRLHACHLRKFHRGPRELPLVEHVAGMGMTAFCMHYISKSRDLWQASEKTPYEEFWQTLCACHTVLVGFDKGELLGDHLDKLVLVKLKRALKDMLVTTPDELDNDAPSVMSYQFLDEFTKRNGPLFIVLDDVGGAFTAANLDFNQQHDKFKRFYEQVLSTWQIFSNIFFVVAGSGLAFVRPSFEQQLGFCDFQYTRLKLNRFGREEIIQIMDHTCLKDDEATTISAHLGT
ncbi:unnamed protein product [Aphanomyces euteiches]